MQKDLLVLSAILTAIDDLTPDEAHRVANYIAVYVEQKLENEAYRIANEGLEE